MRTIPFLAICFTVFSAYAADSGTAHINLNRPGAMERLAQDNPPHFAKVQRILDEVQRQPIDSVSQWMKAEFDAENVIVPPIVLTSYPGKRSIHFRLDKTAYSAIMTQAPMERLIPAR